MVNYNYFPVLSLCDVYYFTLWLDRYMEVAEMEVNI